MKRRMAIHIGINKLSEHYVGAGYAPLRYCESDAQDMKSITNGFESFEHLELIGKPTTKAVSEAITLAAKGSNFTNPKLKPLQVGDLLVVTFSGHGSETKDEDGIDLRDQTWCLWDRQLFDDELAQLWALFNKGVRILFISDSCHSGTVVQRFARLKALVRKIPFVNEVHHWLFNNLNEISKDGSLHRRASRRLIGGDRIIEARYWDTYKSILDGLRKYREDNKIEKYTDLIQASIISISACRDGESAIETDGNGVFTAAIKRLMGNGKTFKNYKEFFEEIIKDEILVTIKSQNPNFYPLEGLPKIDKDDLSDFIHNTKPFEVKD
ncbi:MAG: caspase family protein [Pyrinomonadaceae bacterium]